MIEDLKLRLEKNLFNEDGIYRSGRWQNNKNKELKLEIENSIIGDAETFHEKIWLLLNNKLEIPKCKYCGNRLKLTSIQQGFVQKYCSIKCSANCPEHKKSREDKCIERHGVKSHLSLESVKNKRKKTTKQKYGVEYLFQSKEFRDVSKLTSLAIYGTEYPNSSILIKNKIKQIFDKKYNGHPKKTKEVKQKCIDNLQEAYGIDNIYQREDIVDDIKDKKLKKYRKNNLPKIFQKLKLNNIYPYNWDIEDYIGAHISYEFYHGDCGKVYDGRFFKASVSVCPHCAKNRSYQERRLSNELIPLFSKVDICSRKIIKPYELDIVIDNELAIEVNGTYWHSHEKELEGKMTLLQKTELSPIKLLHFWDIELDNKFNICKSIICSKLNYYENQINASDCNLIKLSNNQTKDFLQNNHLTGYIEADYNIGLEYNGTIVYIICLSKTEDKNHNFELVRICPLLHTIVNGGADKLFNQIKLDFKNSKIISYADKRYSSGTVFKQLGFTEYLHTKPNFHWVKKQVILSSKQCQKLKLQQLLGLENYDEKLSIDKNMNNNGYRKVKDCGSIIFTINI